MYFHNHGFMRALFATMRVCLMTTGAHEVTTTDELREEVCVETFSLRIHVNIMKL